MTITLAKLQIRCTDCPECEERWQWPNALQNGRFPITTIAGKQHYVRRLAWALANPGKALPNGQRRVITSRCQNPRCINPRLLCATDRGVVLKQAWQRGAFQDITFSARVALGRRRHSKLTDEAVAQIRASTETNAALGKQHGVTGTYIGYIKRGQSRVDYAGNPFAGLMA